VTGALVDHRILEGIRVGLIESLCAACGLTFRTSALSRQDVACADELLLSSATKEVLPITRLDGHLVGSGRPGPVYARLYHAYQDAIAVA
jgi:D-alanine transaminase